MTQTHFPPWPPGPPASPSAGMVGASAELVSAS